MKRKKLLLITQVYPPDPASVGQHMADVAENMARKGWDVVVLTPNRGYENHKEKYISWEVLNGVEVSRLSFTSFGKKNIILRLISQLLFLLNALFSSIFIKKPDALLVTTNLAFIIAPILKKFRKIPYLYWVMDLNPDQAIAAGILSKKSLTARLYNFLQYVVLKHANTVISLDRFISKNIENKNNRINRHIIIPPWPHEDHLVKEAAKVKDFKKEHGWGNKRIFMYSGNHSLVHPLDTFLRASSSLKDTDDFLLAFIGGGLGKRQVNEYIQNHPELPIASLPYQPIENLNNSLTAGDVHLVSMGDKMAGCVHPCKVYGAMAIGRPILLLGNENNHIAEIINEYDIGWSVQHGDIDSMVKILKYLISVDKKVLEEKGHNAKVAIKKEFSQKKLLSDFCSNF